MKNSIFATMEVYCLICNNEIKKRWGKAKLIAKTCSNTCSKKYQLQKREQKLFESGQKCANCGKLVYRKPSRVKLNINCFCSVACVGEYRKKDYIADKNPNYRSRMYDSDGYRLQHSKTYGRQKLSHVITLEVLGINTIPKGYHVHHRDCDHHNDTVNNLVLLTISDHRWLHAQFGSATLWAYLNNKIDITTLISWSNDKERALRLLPLNLNGQIGVFKSDKLLEHPEMKLDEK